MDTDTLSSSPKSEDDLGEQTTPQWLVLEHTCDEIITNYAKQAKNSPHMYTPARTTVARKWVCYAYRFDSTKGFPGEGPPVKIVTYNINGAKNKLSTTLFLANQAKIDALLIQEIHYYEDGTHLRVANMAKHRGWTAFVAHDSHRDPRGGAAIFIRNNSENIKLPSNTRTLYYPSDGKSLQGY